MSKKLDYLKIISELTSEQYAVYSIIVGRAKYFITRLYNEINKESIASREEFSRKFFTEYMLQTIDGYTTRVEAQLLNWLIKFPKFFEWYKGNWSYESLISSVLFYWKKKPNSLKLTKLFMIYSGYIRFINSRSGYCYLSTYRIDDKESFNLDLAHLAEEYSYDNSEEVLEKIIECKKIVISEIAQNGQEHSEALALWDSIFNTTSKYSDKNTIKILKKRNKDLSISDMTIRRHLEKMRYKLIEAILKDDRVEKYFNSDSIYEYDGHMYSLRGILTLYLRKETTRKIKEKNYAKNCKKIFKKKKQESFSYEAMKRRVEQFNDRKDKRRIINGRVNFSSFSPQELFFIVREYFGWSNLYSEETGYHNALCKLKMTYSKKYQSTMISDFGLASMSNYDVAVGDLHVHKTAKIWIYKDGGYYDFATKRGGLLTDLIPVSYFEAFVKNFCRVTC